MRIIARLLLFILLINTTGVSHFRARTITGCSLEPNVTKEACKFPYDSGSTTFSKNNGSSGKQIVFTSDGCADVIISGADEANSGWRLYSGNIYKKAVALPVTGYIEMITGNSSLLANQVFVDGKMMIEA